MVGDEALEDGYHVAQVKRVHHASDGHLVLFECDLDGGEVDVLDDTGPSSVHLLHKLPHPVIYNEIVLLLLNIGPEVVPVVEQLGVIDAPEFPLRDIFQICRVLLGPLLLNEVDGGALHSRQVLLDELRFHSLPTLSGSYLSGRSNFRIC
jgi:hypothetical protein